MRRAATIVEPAALAALEDIKSCELLLASIVRSANLLIKVETMVPFNNTYGKRKNPTLYQRLIVAKYNHSEREFLFSQQGRRDFTPLDGKSISTYFLHANRVVIFEPVEISGTKRKHMYDYSD